MIFEIAEFVNRLYKQSADLIFEFIFKKKSSNDCYVSKKNQLTFGIFKMLLEIIHFGCDRQDTYIEKKYVFFKEEVKYYVRTNTLQSLLGFISCVTYILL